MGLVFLFFCFGVGFGCGLGFFGFFSGVVKMEEERRRWGGEGRLGMEGLGEGWVELGGGGEV